VQGLGSAGEVVEVKNGYARNYLVPRGFAVNWSRGGAAQVAASRQARGKRAIATKEEAIALKEKLESAKIRIEVKAGTGGRLFGSVKPALVAQAAAEQGLGEFDNRKRTLPTIKSTGEYKGVAHLHEGIDAHLTIKVITER